MRVAAIASIWNRAKLLENTIESLYDQVDHLYICLNNYPEVPLFLDDDKITFVVKKNHYGDAYKFSWTNQDCHYFPCDDDIIYPPTYCRTLQDKVDELGGVITLHGRIFDNFPIQSYYHLASHRTFCTLEQAVDEEVMFGGTGVMCFNTKDVRPNLKYFRVKNMADIWMGLWCKENGIKITSIAHAEEWIKTQDCKGIWDETHNKDWKQTKIINEFFEKKL